MKSNTVKFWAFCFLFSGSLHAQTISCADDKSKSCEITLRTTSGGVYVEARDGRRIFISPEEESSMDTISIYKTDQGYSIFKENFGSGRSKSIISLDSNLGLIRYTSLNREIDLSKNKIYWAGFYCNSTDRAQQSSSSSLFEGVFEYLCRGRPNMELSTHRYSGKDVIFTIHSLDENPSRKIELIALDAGISDNVSIFDFGCIAGCQNPGNTRSLTGRVGSSKIKMNIDLNEGVVKGVYYYDKYKKDIAVKGEVDDGRLRLYAANNSGAVVEIFDGTVSGGLFSGVWTNLSNGKTLPFHLYLSII